MGATIKQVPPFNKQMKKINDTLIKLININHYIINFLIGIINDFIDIYIEINYSKPNNKEKE